MASICNYCNYTQSELLNASGLGRQGHGVLFPYNPEFYDRASGLYGPGTIIAWNMLFVSLVINAIVSERPDQNPGRHKFWSGMSGELVTFVAYPMFAATDLLVNGIQLIGDENRALVLHCLRNPSENMFERGLRDVDNPQHPIDRADIPPDILSLGQRVVEVTGPLDVSYNSFLPLVGWTLFTLANQAEAPKNTAAVVFMGAGTSYIVLLVFIFHCTLGSFWVGILLTPFKEAARIVWKIFAVQFIMADIMVAGGVILVFLVLGSCCFHCITCCRCLPVGDDRETRAAGAPVPQDGNPEENFWLQTVGGFTVAALFFWLNLQWFDTLRPVSPWVPDLGIAISEQDQLAALIAASLSLCYTLYCAVKKMDAMDAATEVGDTVELQSSLLPGRDAHDVEALAGARRVSTM